jgi:hypothetical protein
MALVVVEPQSVAKIDLSSIWELYKDYKYIKKWI